MRLEIGYNHDFEVREETYLTATGPSFTVLYLSDLHLTSWSGPTIHQLEQTIARLNPRILLLGGDYVDCAKGLRHFARLLEFLADRELVFAVAGNHDVFFGVERLRQLAERNKLVWLTDTAAHITLDGYQVRISADPTKLTEDVDFSILCLHKPINITKLRSLPDLAFAGHLHGSQFVFWQSAKGLFPGRLFYRWNILKTTVGRCLYLISKGLGDTLPIRYNCKKDVVFVTVKRLI
ncbi:metallophosphoesterase [Hymenobacter cellulosivorans]|uniref:Metallophosphoesterase n=1 Tax=Hymenobacter cellulosivorans TaxID=2932249 RepID=A0ABY4F750_9BACT|nr:metallophosphoesterase [Hymenobacter cellulosivorans]UOQ52491.1 metallophosphoesterase [Hymenobacter cellulosivorans]